MFVPQAFRDKLRKLTWVQSKGSKRKRWTLKNLSKDLHTASGRTELCQSLLSRCWPMRFPAQDPTLRAVPAISGQCLALHQVLWSQDPVQFILTPEQGRQYRKTQHFPRKVVYKVVCLPSSGRPLSQRGTGAAPLCAKAPLQASWHFGEERQSQAAGEAPAASWTSASTPRLTSLTRCEECQAVFNYMMQVRPCVHTAPEEGTSSSSSCSALRKGSRRNVAEL